MTTIHVSDETKARLDERGSKGDSYNDIVERLLDQTETTAAEDS